VKSKPYFIIYIALFAFLLWFDRFTKNLVMTHMNIGDAIPSADAFVAIRYTINTGVSFSMFEGHTGALIAVQSVLLVIVTAACVITYIKLRHPALQTGLCWIACGGAGNLIDRAVYGYVVDFISVGTFPVWNFADMCVVGGCILLGIYLLFLHTKRENAVLPDGSETFSLGDPEPASYDGPEVASYDGPEPASPNDSEEFLSDESEAASPDGPEAASYDGPEPASPDESEPAEPSSDE